MSTLNKRSTYYYLSVLLSSILAFALGQVLVKQGKARRADTSLPAEPTVPPTVTVRSLISSGYVSDGQGGFKERLVDPVTGVVCYGYGGQVPRSCPVSW